MKQYQIQACNLNARKNALSALSRPNGFNYGSMNKIKQSTQRIFLLYSLRISISLIDLASLYLCLIFYVSEIECLISLSTEIDAYSRMIILLIQ